MPIDPGVFLRLKLSIDATLAGLEQRTLAAQALAEAYASFRSEAERVAEVEGVLDEFGRLFPLPTVARQPSVSAGFDPVAAASGSSESRSLLLRLSGWLGGFVEQTRLELEARAYAEARTGQERRS